MDAAATLVPAKVRDSIQDFNVGDTVKVNVTIREGDRTRVQAFQGIVLKGSYTKQKPPSPNATFTVRRVSYGTGVERTFLICSPLIDSLENSRRGKVAQGRLFYLRGLSGKKARIKEKRFVPGTPAVEETQVVPEPVAPPAPVAEAAPAQAPSTPAQPAKPSDQAKA